MTELIRLPVGMMNCYLLRLGDRAILLDSAGPGTQGSLLEALRRVDQPPETLQMILLTHNHPDHSGTALWLRATYGLPIALHPLDATVGPLKTEGPIGFFLNAIMRATPGDAPPLLADIPLENGMNLKEYGIPGSVLHLPGHTAGSVGLLLDGRRFLCGDLYMNIAGPHLAYMAEDFDRMRLSEQKLMAHPIDTVFPGHGRPFRFARVQGLRESRAAFRLPFTCPEQADCSSSTTPKHSS